MNARVEPLRVGLAMLTTLGLVIAMMMVFGGAPARAGHVEPVLIEGNENCEAATGLQELTKFEPVQSGTQDGVTIVVHGDTFDWTSTVTIAAVFVKGGSNGNLYDYRPAGAVADSGLHAPVNPNNNQFFGLSHITFCIPDTTEETTTTVEETTTTVEETTTTAEETTTTVEETTTTVEETTTTTIEDEVLGTVITTSTTVPTEVLDTEVEAEELPFTGVDSELLVGMAVLMLMSGLLVLGVTGRREES